MPRRDTGSARRTLEEPIVRPQNISQSHDQRILTNKRLEITQEYTPSSFFITSFCLKGVALCLAFSSQSSRCGAEYQLRNRLSSFSTDRISCQSSLH